MSWSFYQTGKPSEVAERAKQERVNQNCSEPEQSIKNSLLDAVVTAVESCNEDKYDVRVESFGSQAIGDGGVLYNTCTVRVEAMQKTAS